MSYHLIVDECKCTRGQSFVHDEEGEDCNAWEAYKKAIDDNEPCSICGTLPRLSLSYDPRVQPS